MQGSLSFYSLDGRRIEEFLLFYCDILYCTDSQITFAGSGSGSASYQIVENSNIRFCMEVPYLSPEMVRSTPVWPILSRCFIRNTFLRIVLDLICKHPYTLLMNHGEPIMNVCFANR